ncbi:MAG: class I SAM-dependent RNA methyltransferase [Anaerolineae bacterium]
MTTRSTYRLATTGITHQGYAVGRLDGRATFAAYALPGETVEIELRRSKPEYAIGDTISVIEPAHERVSPPCAVFNPEMCGGCQWQHASYDAQLRYKTQIVAEQLTRIGRITAPSVKPTIGSPSPFGYRTHATFSVLSTGRLGYVRTDGQTLLPIDACLLLRPELQEVLEWFRTADFTGAERIRLQVGSVSDDRAVIVYGQPRNLTEILNALGGASLILQMGNQTRVVKGKPYLTYVIANRRYRATAGGFFQVNLPQAECLIRQVESQIPETCNHVLDLYSGAGLFSLLLSDYAKRITSIEEYEPAVDDARHNLRDHPNASIQAGSVEHLLGQVKGPIDMVVTDPPRAGMKRSVVDQLVRLNPRRIVYVSCEPSTLARDARLLVDSSYTLGSVQPVDMFPQTYHIETIACFDRD